MSSNAQQIAQAIQALPRAEIEQLREWIEDYLEDQMEITDEFASRIERGKADIAAGNLRVPLPG